MLINFDNDLILKDYFNLTNDRNNVLSPKEGLTIGNMFYDEYEPYKNYKPSEIKVYSDKERELLKIRQLCFAVNDLNLALDLDPKNEKLFRLFKNYNEELNKLTKLYNDKYDVLNLCDDVKNSYTWYKSPWPWEGDKYV